MKLSRETLLQVLLLMVIVFGVYFIFADFSLYRFNSADASTYLNIAENIAEHKGFVVSFNLYQFFNTLDHPIWPYMQSIYPVLCSLVFMAHGGIEQVIQMNILLFGLNVFLTFYIIQELVPTRLNILFISFLVFSMNFFISALYAWTEQFDFLCFIITFILFLKYMRSPRHLMWLGFLNGIFMLVRVAHMYNFMAFLAVLFIGKDPLRRRFERAFFLTGGFVLAYGLYQLFCLFSYHAFYPQYAHPGASYFHARLFGGNIYNIDKVGIQVSLGPLFSLKNFLYIGQHLWGFYLQMPLLIWPAFFYYFLPAEKKRDGGVIALCFAQSIFTIFGYSFTFYWSPYFPRFEFLRYSMIPYVLMSVAGWYSLYQWLSPSKSLWKKLFGMLVLLGLLYPQVSKYIAFKSDLLQRPFWASPYYKDLMEGYSWIDKNLPENILVASDEDQQGYFMHRPFISTPPGKSYTCANLKLFDHVYSPDYYLMSSNISDECFAPIAHAQVFANKTFRILKVIKAS